MKFYAQVNDESIVIGVSQLAGTVEQGNMVQIEDYDTALLGMRYNAETEEFEDVPEPEPVIPEPTEQEIINAELLLGQASLAESNMAIEGTVAMSLLETVGGGV